MTPAQLGAAQAARLIRQRKLSCEELVRDCLARVALREAAVEAWTYIDPDQALAQARELDNAGEPRGPLHGLPIGVKDVLDTADMPTQYGSPIYRNHQPRADAACVAAARNAGGLILGKTTTTEFASTHPNTTRNPHKLAHTPGGSSSGSAAAVADAMVPLAFGTQTGGSTIRPAAYCGIVGYKPSFNLINRAGLKFSAESLDTIGLFARSVEDVALFAHAVSGQELPGWDVAAPPRIGLHRTPHWQQAAAPVRAALEQAARTLAAAGAQVEEVEFGPELAALYSAQELIMTYEATRASAWETRMHHDLLSADFAARMHRGMAIPHAQYQAALAQAEMGRERFVSATATVDLLLTPSAIDEAPLGLASTGASLFNRNWTLLGVPCVHLPTGKGPQGLPLGVQLVGRRGKDVAVLRAAHWVESALARRGAGTA